MLLDRSKFQASRRLPIYKSFIRLRFKEIREYMDTLDDLIRSEQAGLQKRIREEEDEELIEFHIDDLYRYDQTYPQLLRCSALVASYSLFESSLVRVCEIINVELPDSIPKKFHNIDTCWEYLKTIDGDLSEFVKDWDEISTIRRIRNLITHNSSNLIKDKTIKNIEELEIYSYLKRTPSIEVKNERGDFAS